MSGVTFRSLWPSGASSLFISLNPPFSFYLRPFIRFRSEKKVLIYAGHGWPWLILVACF